MEETSVLIVGGYGDVGKFVVGELLLNGKYSLVIGGRNEEKARQLISKYKSSDIMKYFN